MVDAGRPDRTDDGDLLILVNDRDEVQGSLPKIACHTGEGVLHRAFSIFVFNSSGEVLLQRRSAQKHLWPLYWSNSCCSHPRSGEAVQDAVHRRLMQELGITAELSFHYDFIYKAQYLEIGTEHELCSVWMGTSDDPIAANKDEIEAWRFVDPQHLQAELEQTPESFTPWMKLEWQRITKEHLSE
jgi:isopentenyl-diphosphate delta-isomerase|tara:strand:+ start:8300 stop:8854 length:555 start_codon:yes stop_codon:yes gene_type:complete